MTAQPASGMYTFSGDKSGNAPSEVPAGYPYLGVKIGGGMAAAYNHRTHMFPEDMPSMHLVDVADSFNGLGYYMYHGECSWLSPLTCPVVVVALTAMCRVRPCVVFGRLCLLSPRVWLWLFGSV